MDAVNSVARTPLYDSINCDRRGKQKNCGVEQGVTAAVSRTQSSDITIVTAEGDTVAISAGRTSEHSFSTYNARGHSLSRFSLSVEGDLNKQELKDIRRAIKTIEKAARAFLSGDVDKAAERTAKLSRLDQLASIEAVVRFQQEFLVSTTE